MVGYAPLGKRDHDDIVYPRVALSDRDAQCRHARQAPVAGGSGAHQRA
jgi:hypothetical protein